MSRDWNESQATSIKATSSVNWTGTLAEGDYDPQYESETIITLNHGWKAFPIPQMTQTWVNNPSSNKGVVCIAANEDDPGYDETDLCNRGGSS